MIVPALITCGLLIATIGNAHAQVHRCERAGKIAFSDQPCEVGDKASQKVYSSSAASNALDMQVVVTHYSVEGMSDAALARSLKANGPGGFHGLASWNVSFNYTTKKRSDACEIDAVRIKVSGEILMPRWTDESSAPPPLQERWRKYYAALKRHEDGHILHGKELALRVAERLMGIGAMPCGQIQSLAQGEFQRTYNNQKTRDQEYDARTNHGKAEGAVF